MPDTFILRFRDVTGDNPIAQHRKLISSVGYVWWGWWKKDSEPQRAKELEEFQARAKAKSFSVGLFDRSKPAFFAAEISDSVYSAGEIASPEPSRTPAYYSTEKVAAWFKLNSIEELDEQTFSSRFAAPPVGEWTFFPVWRSSPQQTGSNNGSMGVVKLTSSTVLHLSDVHLGSDYGFPADTAPGRTPLINLIERDFQDEKPGLVVVSGDFTTRADANVLLDDGLRFLVNLSERLGIARECFVLVPGNHDIALKKWRPQDYSHENSFHLFMKEFYGQRRPFPELRDFQLDDGRALQLLTINSVRLRHESEKQFGYVQWPLYEGLLGTAPHDPDVIRVAVLHHHLTPAPREETLNPEYREASVSTTLDAGSVIEGLQKHGFGLALHGHQHVPAMSHITRAPRSSGSKIEPLGRGLRVLAAGSAGACFNRLSDEMRDNSYNIVRLRRDKPEIEARRYTPASSPQTLFRFRLS